MARHRGERAEQRQSSRTAKVSMNGGERKEENGGGHLSRPFADVGASSHELVASSRFKMSGPSQT